MDKYSVLKDIFGYESFRGGQEEIIDALLAGRDALCVMPTGAGKSVCYQLPALLLPGVTLVVSPLISLMKDQVSALTGNGVKAAFINSSLTFAQYKKVLSLLNEGAYKIVYVAPERLETEGFLAVCKNLTISLVAVDEAHCVSQWGQDFRPSYLKIADFIGRLPTRPTVGAFTATATAKVKQDIADILALKDPYRVTTGFDRPNLFFEVLSPAQKEKDALLVSLIQSREEQSGIVYCATRKTVEEVCAMLRDEGIAATRYHAGLSEQERRDNQEDFEYDRAPVMVATNAFGMGIDKSNVSFVIHYNIPKDLESYYQEAGRAGRDGSPADCILLYSPKDVRLNQFLIDRSGESEELDAQTRELLRLRDRERLKYMTWYCSTADCLRKYILKYFGERAPEYCGNCGSCRRGHVTEDITTDAQKILSCVARVDGRFGVSTVCAILRGAKTERLMRLGLQKLSTYGIMSDVSEKKLRDECNALLVEGYLLSTGEDYPVLSLTARAREVLFEGGRVEMTVPRAAPKREKKKTAEPTAKAPLSAEDGRLFLLLRQLRLRLANESHIPAYVVFPDTTLADMCQKRPKTLTEFLEVSGVGTAKMQLYGEEFTELIARFEDGAFD